MVSASSAPAGSVCPLAHPDHELLAEAYSALEWWMGQQPVRPTSSLTGGGAIAAAEMALSDLVQDRPVLAAPSATFALLVALQTAGVSAGDEVLVSGVDWPAARAAAQILGARPVPMPVGMADFTVDPAAAATLVTPATRAVVVTHLHGLVADVPRLRFALPEHVVVIEDCAQAFGATRSGQAAGTFGDYAVFSLGPGKVVSAGEMGLLTASDPERYRAAVAVSQHPIRQALTGIAQPREDVLIGRPAPFAALSAAHKLTSWPARAAERAELEATARSAIADTGATLLGSEVQRPQPGCIPLVVESDATERAVRSALRLSFDGAAEISVSPSGACVDPGLGAPERTRLTDALGRVRLVVVRLLPNHDRR